MTPVQDFLAAFHGSEPTHFRLLGKGKVTLSPHNSFDVLEEELREKNDEGYNVYFVVNSGGTKTPEITRVNAVFADFDKGDRHRKNGSLAHKGTSKPEAMAILEQFPLTPSFVVETANGIHAYWLVKNGEGITPSRFRAVQEALNQRLGSDKRVNTIARIMRVPSFASYSKKDGKQNGDIRVLKAEQARYAFEEIAQVLDVVADDDSTIEGGSQVSTSNTGKPLGSSTCGHLCPPCGSFENGYHCTDIFEAQTILKQVDLCEHLHESSSLCCPFHDDTSPSASIFRADDGRSLLKCHAECGVFDIIDIAKANRGCSWYEAVAHLMAQYSMEWDLDIPSYNLEVLESEPALRANYPHLYRRIRVSLPYLTALNQHCFEAFWRMGIRDDEGAPIITSSMRFLSKQLHVNEAASRTSDRLKRLVAFDLLLRYEADDLPEWVHLHEVYERYTSFWGLPKLTNERLLEAEQLAETMHRRGETVASLVSRESIQRRNGLDAAKKLCPQTNGSLRWDESYEKLAAAVSKLIDEHGHATQSQILHAIGWTTNSQQIRLRRMMPAIAHGLGLERIYPNKSIKHEIGATFEHYPPVWVTAEIARKLRPLEEGG